MSQTEALQHILQHHTGADGWITLSRKESGQGYRQHHYKLDELLNVLPEWLGEDVYFSQNTFYRPARRIENIRQLRSLYVDVDCYLLNMIPEWVIQQMEMELFGDKIPNPNLIIHSGRGLALVWLIDPVPSHALPLWQAVENYFVKQLRSVGSDARASDAARILRLAGTKNGKNHEFVTVQHRHNARYTLRDLEREYLPALNPKRSQSGTQGTSTRRNVEQRLFNTYTLHYQRLQDLVMLCEIRKWEMTGYRETTLFLYRYWSCCFLADADEALQHTLEINAQFRNPLTEREAIRATKSAEGAWKARSNAEASRLAKEQGYPGAGYNVSNRKLIEWLDITVEEQRRLDTIVDRSVKYERNNKRREKARRAAGKQTREEYIGQAEERRREAIRLRNEGMTQKQISKVLNTSQAQVSRMLSSSF